MAAVHIVGQSVVGGEEKVGGVYLGGLVLIVDVVGVGGMRGVEHVGEGAAEVGGVAGGGGGVASQSTAVSCRGGTCQPSLLPGQSCQPPSESWQTRLTGHC